MQVIKTLLKKYRFLLVIGGFLLRGYAWITNIVSIEAISNVPQTTIIRARNGEELFRFFEQDRRWVGYDQIAPVMVDAIIAAEDKSFRSNNGTDMSSLTRALIANLQSLWSDSLRQGGSTITQQLIKNVFLTHEKTISRKFQELILARHLTTTWKHYMKKKGVAEKDAFRKAKQEIIASYLNVIFFGNRAHGIEAAAQNYFAVAAKDLNLLQASILASLPQAPSLYNPAQNATTVLGSRNIYSGGDIKQGTLMQTGDDRMFEILQQKSLELGNDCLSNLEQWATILGSGFTATYQRGRKDRVLCRMYELDMVDSSSLKSAFLDQISLQIATPHAAIKAPHFVFWLQEYLAKIPELKGYDEQQLARAGLDITTTLDLGKQQQAEDALLNYMGSLRRMGGNNRAMLHISRSGEILSYVGSSEFFDRDIGGQNDMIQAKRQIGSTIKPFFYAYLFSHYPVTLDTVIVDSPLSGYRINNHDMQFRGKTTLAHALAGSRNLPVARLFFALGGELIRKQYLSNFGFSFSGTQVYDYSLALGAFEASMMQLSQAYLHMITKDQTIALVSPILAIRRNGKPIFLHKKTTVKVIPNTVADMIWSILANKVYMPSDWYRLRNHRISNFALKTGTTDKKVGGEIYPRDAWSVLYSPQDIIISWAGNTNGKEMSPNAFGGELNHYVLRQYIGDGVASGTIQDTPMQVVGGYTSGGYYAGVDHHEISASMMKLLWQLDTTTVQQLLPIKASAYDIPISTGNAIQKDEAIITQLSGGCIHIVE